MKVIITGGRKYSEPKELYEALDKFNQENNITLLIQGGASGADNLAVQWAKSRKIEYQTYSANWKDLTHPDARIKTNPYGDYDANAGHRRNKLMLDEHPEATVLAFKGGHGTRDCIKTAEEQGMTVKRLGSW